MKVMPESLYDSIVYLTVGPDAVKFGVHKGLLCHHSRYFKSHFDKEPEGEIDLDGEDPKTFKRFNDWLYTSAVLHDDETLEDIPWNSLSELYNFAERAVIPRLQNKCMDAVIAKAQRTNSIPQGETLQDIWDNNLISSPMRILLLDFFVQWADMQGILGRGQDIEAYSKDFLASVIVAYCEAKNDGSLQKPYDAWKERSRYYAGDKSNEKEDSRQEFYTPEDSPLEERGGEALHSHENTSDEESGGEGP